MSKITAQDVAVAAGVSLATVDRVLNNRKGVRAGTVERVHEAMERLGYVRDQSAANLARGRSYRVTFLLPEGGNAFMRGLEREVEEVKTQAAKDRVEIRIVTVPPFDSEALAGAIGRLDLAAGEGVALVATESQLVRDAINELRERGVRVVTLISDAPNSRREHYVGIDNVAAGRAAASLLGRFLCERQGEVAVVAGSMILRDHVERRLGFEQVMRSEYGHLALLPSVEGFDDADVVEEKLGALLAKNRRIIGLYSLGGGTRGVVRALEAANRPIRAITHEVTEHSRRALTSGRLDAVLAQDPGHEVRSAIRVLRAFADDAPIVDSQERIRIEIFVRDNLP